MATSSTRLTVGNSSAPRKLLTASLLLALVAALLISAPLPAHAACAGNAIVCENQLPGTPASVWDVDGVGDGGIQGFSTRMSVNAGSPVSFKIENEAATYSIKIYRLGYYQGNGAREIATLNPQASLAKNQPACATDPATEIYDCGTWKVSATWNVPATAVSGVYIAHLIRGDNGGSSHIPFVVRNDGNTSQALFQTSDTTWQAYNTYGGSNLYWGGANGRAYKVSYNRPFSTRGLEHGRDFLFSNEYPMIRFLEQNGYDVSYVSGQDTHADPALITKHKAFLSVGHDEYWSKEQRDNVLAARDAGTNLAFFGGNDVYWKIRWEASQDGTNTANRTLVCYKDTWENTRTDPVSPTATWRDPRFGNLGHGPENSLIGTQYQANSVDLALKVSAAEGKLRLWRNTALANQTSGSTTLAAHTVGYESNEDVDNGFRPAGLIHMSTTTGPTPEYAYDFGKQVRADTTTHHLTQYRANSGALVFSAGTVQWAWGLDPQHDGADVQPADPRIRQATANILADMNAFPTTLASGLVMPTKSTDTTAPTTTISQPTAGATIAPGTTVTVTGTATDTGGRVGGVEVSVDGGMTFHPASGRESYSYTGVISGSGADAIQVRAADDSGNLQANPTKLSVTSNCPCSIFGSLVPKTPATSDASATTLGTRFQPANNGFITGIRFYKGTGNTGTHTGTLYSATGAVLATGTFSNETASGWQTLSFPNAVAVTAGTTYVAAYFAPNGHYSADSRFFAYRPFSSGSLTALGGYGQPNGVFANNSQFPTESYQETNYYVDAIYNATDTTPLSVSAVSPADGSTSNPVSTKITATFSRPIDGASASFTVRDPDNQVVPGAVSYDSATRTATFDPTSDLATAKKYTVRVTANPATGVGLPAPYDWSFTSAKAAATPGECPCTLFDDADGPTSGPESDTDRVQLGVAFTSNTAGTIRGVRFYKAAANVGTHTISLWSNSGSQLATATVTGESTAGWQEANFASPVSINANTTYIASYLAPNGRYSAKAGGLSAKINRPPLASLANGGRYTYGSGAPTRASATNYFVDPVFMSAPDLAPTVVSTKPGANATSVPVANKLTVDFSGAVQSGTTSVVLKRTSDGATVSGNTTTSSSSVTFTPTNDLAAGTKYTATVSGARSSGGAPMVGNHVTSFTTAGPEACPCSLMETTTEPETSDSDDGGATTLGLRFTPSVDGSVKGIRYYRDAANTGTHRGKLWSSNGDLLATVTFNDSGTGWQSADFNTAINVDAGTTYVVSYYAPNGHYSVAQGYFNDTVQNPPLSSSGSGGVYADGDNFPNQSYLKSNYYVDVVFTTNNTAAPTVTDTSPNEGATAAVDANLTAKFSRAMTASSIDFQLTGPGGAAVAGQTSYDADTRTASFNPTSDLAASTAYTARIEGTSSAGTAMASPKTWSFTTRAASPTGQQVSLFSLSDTPAVPAWDDSDPVTVGVRFSSSQAGKVTAIRFYAGQGNTGGQTVNLWNSAGDSLATGTATGSGVGWRTVTFDTPVDIQAGQTYTASYRAPAGRYSVTSNAFANPYTSGPLTVAAGGATYRYSAGAPTANSNANYWVDVIVVVPE